MKPAIRMLLAAYVCALACFLLMDSCWLSLTGQRLYQPAIGALMSPQVDWRAVALFYPLYLVGLMVFAIVPGLAVGRPAMALGRGALLGLVSYAAYDLTNQATLRGWPWSLTLVDMVWGVVVSATSAWVGTWLGLWADGSLTSRPRN